MRRIAVSLAILVNCASLVHAECRDWSEFKSCEKIRNDNYIFVGRAIAVVRQIPPAAQT